jgi:RimJ/RimL family protein N-acetyltransferase
MPAATPDRPVAFRYGMRTTRWQDGAVTDLHLRRWYPADGDAVLAALHADPGLSRQMGALDLSLGRGAAEAYVLRHLVPADGRLQLAVVRGEVVVGNVGVTGIERTHGTGWTHYWLAPVARGQGIARRALATLADLAFADGLERLEIGHRTENPASCRVAMAAGFPAEGIERAKLRYGDRRYDVETHARLRDDPAPALDTLTVL